MTGDTKTPHLVVIDGLSFLFRAFHGVRGNLSRADGLPTNALFGFAQMLVRVVDDLKPDLCVVALDSIGKTFRSGIYPEYKAHRPPLDEAMRKQLDFFEPMIEAFGIPAIRVEGVEADDIIATLAVRSRKGDLRGLLGPDKGAAHGVQETDGPVRMTIVSSDKDLMQLLGGSVRMLDTMKDKWFDIPQVEEKFGVGPDKVVEVLALMGDSSDNVPGVMGVGPKTATDLIVQFGSVEQVYARLNEVKRDTLREKLSACRADAEVSRRLVMLKDDVVLPEVDMSFHPHLHEAADYLRDVLEFRGLAARLEKRKNGDGVKAPESAKEEDAALPVSPPWDDEVTAEAAPEQPASADDWYAGYECVQTLERWQAWMQDVRAKGIVAFDTETTSLDPYEAKLVGVSLATGAGKACYVPLLHGGAVDGGLDLGGEVRPEQVDYKIVLADVLALLADARVRKIGHNLKYDWLVVARAAGITPDATGERLQQMMVNYDDTLLMSACADGGRWGHGLDESALRHLNHVMIKYEEVCGRGKAQVTFDRVPLDAATRYAAEDADATWRLWEVMGKRLGISGLPVVSPLRPEGSATAATDKKEYGPAYVYEQVEKPLLPIIVAMEARGVRVDGPFLRELSDDLGRRLAAFEAEIHTLAGEAFNVNSPAQLGVILFDKLGLGSDKHKKNRSTAVGVLEEIEGVLEEDVAALPSLPAQQHVPVAEAATTEPSGEGGLNPATRGLRLIRAVLGYRQLAKLRSTYTEALMQQVSRVTGRVHTSYHQVGAATGRFSSTEPNLQNIPIRTEEGRKIRKAFIARQGWLMMSADYSQIELRLLAHFSGSVALRRAFVEGFDVHAYTASLIYGEDMDRVTKEQRRAAKIINFGLVYGMGARSLAKQIGVSMQDAQAWIDAYFKRYEGVREYMDANKKFAREHGYVETLLGRRVWLPEIDSKNGGLRSNAERAAINAPLQGSNADVIKLAMPRVERVVGTTDARLLMQVHDELVFEVAPEAVERVRADIKTAMEGVVALAVPLLVETGVGPNWDDAH